MAQERKIRTSPVFNRRLQACACMGPRCLLVAKRRPSRKKLRVGVNSDDDRDPADLPCRKVSLRVQASNLLRGAAISGHWTAGQRRPFVTNAETQAIPALDCQSGNSCDPLPSPSTAIASSRRRSGRPSRNRCGILRGKKIANNRSTARAHFYIREDACGTSGFSEADITVVGHDAFRKMPAGRSRVAIVDAVSIWEAGGRNSPPRGARPRCRDPARNRNYRERFQSQYDRDDPGRSHQACQPSRTSCVRSSVRRWRVPGSTRGEVAAGHRRKSLACRRRS